ncbi:MAG TPA: tripartite tricarboxylate transporter substrate binding protein, partial [Burkholderiales bacterium]|nr:tripartite tricarboxylate transporter substrate binding protein [Burkholderiales bacterium]
MTACPSQFVRNSAPGAAALIAATLLLFAGPQALAQNWPTKTVRVIVPFSPGGTADTLGRLVAQKLSETLKENFIVENRGGAGGV